MRTGIAQIVILIGLSSGGCVLIPHPIEPEVVRTEDIVIPADTLVTLGDYKVMEDLTKRLKKNDFKMEIVDPLEFRDAVFPEGGWQLQELMTPDNCARTMRTTGVTHMALVGPVAYDQDAHGFAFMYGAYWGTEEYSLAAVVYDLRSQDIVCRIQSDADAFYGGLLYIVYRVGTRPMTESGMLNGLANEIAAAISEDMDGVPTKIALMGAESPSDSTPLTEDTILIAP